MTEKELTAKKLTRYRAARSVAVVSFFFLLLVAVILLVDFYHLKTVDPLETPALVQLRAQLAQEPGSQVLKEQIRELDLLARRAFFTRQWQLKAGAYFLLGFGAVLIVALQVMGSILRRFPDLKRCPGLDNEWTASGTARKIIGFGGVSLIIAGIVMTLGIRGEWKIPKNNLESQSSTETEAPAVERAESAAESSVTHSAETAALGFPEEMRRNWPTFRGTGAYGHAGNVRPPQNWDVEKGTNVLWRTEIPLHGFNSPVVWGENLFLTGATNEKQVVFCFDTESGGLRWQSELQNVPGAPSEVPEVTSDTGHAAPSAATDGKSVFAIFSNGNVAAFDFDGRQLWGRNLGVPQNHYGHSSSLIAWNDLLYVQYDHFGGSTLKALDTGNGETVWEKERTADISWSSPILLDNDGIMQIVLASTPAVSSYNALNGAPLWELEVLSAEVGPSPAFCNGIVFAAQEYSQVVAIKADTGKVIWETSEPALPDAASPVATDKYLFLPTSYGAFTCLNVIDGATFWVHEFDDGSYGSPVLVNDRIYWLTKDGVMQIFKAADRFELVAQPQLGESSFCTPAFVKDRIYIRGEKHLFCMKEK